MKDKPVFKTSRIVSEAWDRAEKVSVDLGNGIMFRKAFDEYHSDDIRRFLGKFREVAEKYVDKVIKEYWASENRFTFVFPWGDMSDWVDFKDYETGGNRLAAAVLEWQKADPQAKKDVIDYVCVHHLPHSMTNGEHLVYKGGTPPVIDRFAIEAPWPGCECIDCPWGMWERYEHNGSLDVHGGGQHKYKAVTDVWTRKVWSLVCQCKDDRQVKWKPGMQMGLTACTKKDLMREQPEPEVDAELAEAVDGLLAISSQMEQKQDETQEKNKTQAVR